MMTKVLAIITLVLLLVNLGCGFAIHYGGDSFQDAVRGHMILGVLTLVAAAALAVNVLVK